MSTDNPLDFESYEQLSEETAFYPDEFPDFVSTELVYVCLGLAEAGEIQEKLKKAIREEDPTYLEDMVDEVGDLLWYVARLPKELSAIDEVDFDGTTEDVARANLEKLSDRKRRDVLTGEGDNR